MVTMLMSTTTQIVNGTNCPTSDVVDKVGYGVTSNCFEGAGPTPAPSVTTSATRAGTDACGDVNDNAIDFAAVAPAPRNSATPAAVCSCVVQNESGGAGEADYCNVQSPLSLNVAAGMSTGDVFGQIFETGVTEAALGNANVRAQLGWGAPTANPQYEAGWTWTNATYNVQAGNNDEYKASFTAPATGSYRYVYRYSLDNGVSWTVCDKNDAPDFGAGSNMGLSFEFADMPVLTVP
jgi:hypothetical protein